MNNKEKYRETFIRVFEVSDDALDELKYQDIKEWDSVGHMNLMAELEDTFDIMMDTDDIVDFSSYAKGIEILAKYGVVIE